MKRLIEVLAAAVTDDSGEALSNGTVTSYLAGTTTLSTIYQDYSCTIPHPNPATLDDAGRLVAYSNYRTKLVLSDSDGAVVRTLDNVGTNDADISVAVTGLTAGDGLLADASGVWSVNTDNSTVEVVGDQLLVKDGGITGAKLSTTAADASTLEVAGGSMRVKDAGITQAKRAALGQQVSSTCISYNYNPSSWETVTNLTVTITTTGRPVFVALIGTATSGWVGMYDTSAYHEISYRFARDGSTIANFVMVCSDPGYTLYIPGNIFHIDTPSAGTYTYTFGAVCTGGANTYARVYQKKLIAFEL